MTQTVMRPAVAAAEADAGLGAVTFMSFEAVEIAHVGMEWGSYKGPVTLTFQHLADAVAAQDDPHILPPRLKIGHDDPRFNEESQIHDPFAYHGPLREDGNPVYGKVENLRLAEDGMVLLGDYVEVPDWLGNALPSAYPSRSLEGDWDIKTDGGKEYSFVITAVALLGEPLPAISCLEDLVRELTGGPVAVREQAPVTLSKEDSMPVSAEASTDSVREQFWSAFTDDPEYWWWWPCEVRVDEGWVLADDDEGHMHRVPFTIDADGVVSWGTPEQGVLDFRPVQSTEPVAASRGVRFSTPAEAGRPKDRVRAGTATDERSDVDISTLREKLDMPDATDDEVIAAATEAVPEPSSETDVPEPAVVPEPVAVKNGVVLDPSAFEQLQTDAAAGREARDVQISAERGAIVEERIHGGFITTSSRAAHLAELDKGGEIEKAHRAYLASLTAAIVPIGERAKAPSTDANDQTQIAAGLAAMGVNTKENR